jgi:DNA polymerase III gamma/tau subunit
MVAKSAGEDSELLILTAEQRKRTSELAEKFDIAALVYNITTLEKLRWSIKNSDTPRALLEALLLRFALSEHFMNVDELLAQYKGNAPAPIKKKQPPVSPVPKPQASSIEHRESSIENRVSSIEHQASSIENRVSSIEHQASNIENRETSNEQKPTIKEVKAKKQGKNNILNDPAVKTVIIGLDATITGIEEIDGGSTGSPS